MACTLSTAVPCSHQHSYAVYLQQQGYVCEVFGSVQHSSTVYVLFVCSAQARRYVHNNPEAAYLLRQSSALCIE